MNWVPFILVSLISLALADLPSCERARCVHCEVEFISRMCPTACGACSRQNQLMIQSTRPSQPPTAWQNSQQVLAPRQAGVPTQNYVPQAFGVAQAPQYSQASTLAPLIEQPRAEHLNPQLARQPADLAQPLPEYQRGFNQGYYQGAQGGYQGAQGGYQGAQQYPQNQAFSYSQPSQQSQNYNPFQPFLFQAGQNPLDPLGLFNNFGQNAFAQGTGVAQVAQSMRGAYTQPQQQQPQAFRGQYPAQNYQQGGQQQVQQPTQQVPQQVQHQQIPQQIAPQTQQNPLSTMQNLFQTSQVPPSPPAPLAIAQPLQPQATVQVTVPNSYKTNSQTQSVQQPLPPTSNNIDSGASLAYKYVDGKGPVPAPPPAQCPKQPGWSPCISKEVANERFRNCCARLGEGCASLCNYDASLATMQLGVLTGRCPLNKVADMMVCASGYEDATPCCEAYNVFEPGYEQCRPYCNPAAGLPQGGPLSDKYKCLVKLGQIQHCFYVSQKP